MSTCAAAGIGIGATVVFLSIVTAVVFAFHMGRRGAKPKMLGGGRGPVEVEGSSPTLAETGVGPGRHELSSKNNPSELLAREVSELDGWYRR